MKFFEQKRQQLISEIVILSAIFGFAGGIVGELVADVYLDPWHNSYLTNSAVNSDPTVSELKPVKRIIASDQDFAIYQAVQKISPAILGIYQKKPTTTNVLNQIYLPGSLLGNGIILTNDGWLATVNAAIAGKRADQLTLVHGQKIFPVTKIVSDKISQVIFLKIDANNLPVATLGDSDEILAGQVVVNLNSVNEVKVNSIKNPDYYFISSASSLVLTSEEYGKSILLENLATDGFMGSPLFNLDGEVIGLVNQINQQALISPVNHFRFLLKEVLKNQLVKRPYLGVTYLDLTQTLGLDQALRQNREAGALIYQLVNNSPAQQFGLEKNDIILSVENQTIDQENNLAELIQQYQICDEINLEILRAGKVINKKVILGQVKD